MGVEKLTPTLEFTNYMICFKGFAECHLSKLQREYCVVLYDTVPNYYTSPFLHHSLFSSLCLDEQSAEDCSKSSNNFHRLNCRT